MVRAQKKGGRGKVDLKSSLSLMRESDVHDRLRTLSVFSLPQMPAPSSWGPNRGKILPEGRQTAPQPACSVLDAWTMEACPAHRRLDGVLGPLKAYGKMGKISDGAVDGRGSRL